MKQLKLRDVQIFEWFDYFHNNPEISWKEYNTTKKITEILTDLNVRHYTFEDVTGVIAEIGTGDEVIAVRADIDALWQEVDGVKKANHSCGHDANISMVLGALLSLLKEKLDKRVRFIFQPAEETGGGSMAMVERDVLDNVTHLFGIHLRPIEELPLGKVSPTIRHGAAVFLQGRVIGEDAHGARPHQGKSALDVMFAIQQAIQSLHVDPFEPYSVKITKIVSDGGSVNIIPGNATFTMDLRAQKNNVLTKIQSKVEERIKQIAKMYDVTIELDWLDLTPGAEVHDEALAIAKKSIVEALGDDFLAPDVVTPGSDDFHFYTIAKPELKATMLGIGANLTPGLHHPKMTFDKIALIIGANALATTIKNAAKENRNEN